MLKSTKDKPGWLIPYLTALDAMFYNRWGYWLNDDIHEDPIPYVPFESSSPSSEVRKNIKKCLDHDQYSYSNISEKFVDWILWGFNYKHITFPQIEERLDDFWYRTFNLGLFYKEPADHFADIAAEYSIGKGGGYFPTPAPVVEMMVKMAMGGAPGHHHKYKSVMDPCCGTGVMLLHASNYSLNLHGVDINPLLCKMAIINGYIYMPWMIYRPKELTMQAIVNVDLPSGMRIPKCTMCGNDKDFLLELETDYQIEINMSGLVDIDAPTISQDIVNKKLRPENITCAKCFQKEEIK